MKKQLLCLVAAALALFSGTVRAAEITEDITSDYLTNASFEDDDVSALDSVINSSDGMRGWTLTAPTGWTVSASSLTLLLVDSGCYTDNNFGLVTSVTDGNYAYYMRFGWGSATGSLTQTTAELPAGTYRLSIDQRTATANSASSSFTLSAGTTEGETVSFTASSASSYIFTTAEWETTTLDFTLDEAASVDIAIAVTFGNGGSSFMIDNVRLYSVTDDGTTDDDADDADDDDDEDEESATLEDGVYYLKVSDEYRYFSQGGWWGTAAVYDEVGMPLTVTAVGDGTYTLLNGEAGTSTYIYSTTTSGLDVYTDNSYNNTWTLTPTTGGYYISLSTNDYYLYPYSETYSTYTYTRVGGTTDQSSATVWEFLTEEEYATSLTERLDAQAVAAASAADITVSTVDELATYLDDNFYAIDLSEQIVNPDFDVDITSATTSSGWEAVSYFTSRTESALGWYDLSEISALGIDVGGVNALAYIDCSMGMEQTISNLAEGIYKVETYALFSPISLSEVLLSTPSAEDLAPASSAFTYAKTASASAFSEVKGYEGETIIDLTTFTVYAESVLPNYTNTNYIYVKEGEDLTVGIAHERHISGNTVLNWHWTLTYYTADAYSIGNPTYSITEGATIAPDAFDGTITVAWQGATSIDDEAALSLLDADAAITLTANDGTTYTGSYTFAEDVLTISFADAQLDYDGTYTLTIPAGIVGFNEANANDELTLTFYTRCNVEGACYLKVAGSEYQYLSRGNDWGTRAVTDSYGSPVELVYTDDGLTIQYLDNSLYLFMADGVATTIYTDNSTYPYWIIRASDEVEGGYELYDGNSTSSNGWPITLDDSGNLAAVQGATPIVWTLQSIDDHNTYLSSLVDDQAIATAAQAGYSVDSKDALAEMLSNEALFTPTDITVTGKTSSSTSEFYQGTQGSATTVFSETVSDLAAGIYKVSVQAYFRIGSNAVTDALYVTYGDLAQGAMFLTANDATQQIISSMSEGYEEAQDPTGSLPDYLGLDSLYHPNSTDQGDYAFEQGLYCNDLYAFVDDDGELTFALVHENNYTPSAWMYYDNFSVTYYAPILTADLAYSAIDPATADTLSALETITLTYDEEVGVNAAQATLSVMDADGEQVATAALEASSNTVTITLDEALTDSGTYTLTIPQGTIGNLTAAACSFAVGNVNAEITLTYIVAPATEDEDDGEDDGEEVGIAAIANDLATNPANIYSPTGQLVRARATSLETLPQGIYIVNGKKVLVK